jgi:hypothetical protein
LSGETIGLTPLAHLGFRPKEFELACAQNKRAYGGTQYTTEEQILHDSKQYDYKNKYQPKPDIIHALMSIIRKGC